MVSRQNHETKTLFGHECAVFDGLFSGNIILSVKISDLREE